MPFRSIDDPAVLRRLLAAVLLLEADLSLPRLLKEFVEEARSMVGARYAALGVLDSDHTGLMEFITAGMDAEQEAHMDHPPQGLGVLGLLITRPEPLRLTNIADHPDSYGFPPGHPPMTSFLGVPVKVRDLVYGNLYLTDKVGWSEFTSDDQVLVEALAGAAGIAIENAYLHERVREVALVEDRDRIAQDLHDAVIQRLFAVGLSLQSLTRSLHRADAADRLTQAVNDIDETIRQIRSTIFELGIADTDQSIRSEILAIAREFGAVAGFSIPARFNGPVDTAIMPPVREHLVATVREGLSNVERHARATSASVTVSALDQWATAEVVDNGIGVDTDDGSGPDGGPGDGTGRAGEVGAVGEGPDHTEPARWSTGGLGLVNLRNRAEKLGGQFHIERADGGGTRLVWRVPLVT